MENGTTERLTLDKFVWHEKNCFAKNAVQSILHTEQASYNPVVFYGASGSGKTCLLTGIADSFNQKERNGKIINCLELTEEFKKCLGENNKGDFITKFVKVDYLFLDDFEYVLKNAIFHHTVMNIIDILVYFKRQIIITMKNSPEIYNIQKELLELLKNGLIVELLKRDNI